jgi:hypothetical protein
LGSAGTQTWRPQNQEIEAMSRTGLGSRAWWRKCAFGEGVKPPVHSPDTTIEHIGDSLVVYLSGVKCIG